jgi:alanine dehydrogenase
MILGIPKEGEVLKGFHERRVGLSPAGVQELVTLGAEVIVAADAGGGAGFRNDDYRSAGARIVYSNEEVIRRSDVTVQVGRPSKQDRAFFNPGSLLLSFLHLGAPIPELVQVLVDKRMTAIGYEIVQLENGSLPILRVSSEIAGKMAVQLAGRLLENTLGGRGVLLGGIPGIPPADVIILGGGTVGYHAARSFVGMGATVYVLDSDLERLRRLDELFQGRVVTALANRANVEKHVAFADVLITCVLIPGQVSPVLVTKRMVETMNPGSVIIDFSIDQGGCVETSKLAPSQEFLFTSHGIVHFCAPNVPAMVARTSSHALTNALLPFLREIVQSGVAGALKRSRPLRRGLYTLDGIVSEVLPLDGLPKQNLEQLCNEME